jgi:hypothetical protein
MVENSTQVTKKSPRQAPCAVAVVNAFAVIVDLDLAGPAQQPEHPEADGTDQKLAPQFGRTSIASTH